MSGSDERYRLHLLLVAPSAPPKNSPEAIQVGRILAVLDEKIRVTLVTTPVVSDWQWHDESLELPSRVRLIVPKLPFHDLSQRIIGNRRLSSLHLPDSDFWIAWFCDYVVKKLDDVPDVIYSRSSPFSAAMLGLKLKKRLGRPWMMHLSDPWADNPYHLLSEAKMEAQCRLEQECFREADAISLTTPGQADFYRRRYPARSEEISIIPNMMPIRKIVPAATPQGPILETVGEEVINLVHVGALYGERDPSVLIKALDMVRQSCSPRSKRLRVHFVGNMSSDIAKLIDTNPQCIRYGPVGFALTSQIMSEADLLLSIERSGSSELDRHFLLSKIVDYLASDKAILAITPPRSITAEYCRRGYGWAFAPDDVAGLAAFLMRLLEPGGKLVTHKRPEPPSELEPKTIVGAIEKQLHHLHEANLLARQAACAR